MKIGIAGYTGRVGQLLIQELQSGTWADLELAGGFAPDAKEETFFTTTSAEELFERADIVIDFTRPEGTIKNAQIAAETGTKMIIGTTGLTNAEEEELKSASEKTAIVYAANTSVGVNILLALVEKAAKALGPEDWDIEIFESHHKHKVDAPSGTALAIGKAASKGREVEHDKVAVRARDGITGERETGTIGYSVARGGGGLVGIAIGVQYPMPVAGILAAARLNHGAAIGGALARCASVTATGAETAARLSGVTIVDARRRVRMRAAAMAAHPMPVGRGGGYRGAGGLQ